MRTRNSIMERRTLDQRKPTLGRISQPVMFMRSCDDFQSPKSQQPKSEEESIDKEHEDAENTQPPPMMMDSNIQSQILKKK